MNIKPPAPNPCGSCPYRKDVPSGIWHEEEYHKLAKFDLPTFAQPPSVFMCHRQDNHLCAGWVGVHNMDESLGIRVALQRDMINPVDMPAIQDYKTDTPLFGSGTDAALHGLRQIRRPGKKAKSMMKQVARRTL